MFLVAFVPGLAAHIRGVGGSTPPTATIFIMIFFHGERRRRIFYWAISIL